jgi:hypothetical protein
MKKLLGALAVSAALTGTTFASPFTDVPSSHWAYGAINDVVASGIMKGYRGGMFKGNETVNRYEMAIIVSRLMKKAHGKTVGADVRRTMDRLGEEFMDELDLIGARLTALENAFHEHVTTGGDTGANGFNFSGEARVRWENRTEDFGATTPAPKDDASRWQARTLLDVEKSVDRADFFVQLAADHTFGVENADGTGEVNLELNQAWVNFAVTDNTSLKVGRQTLERGNGTILSRYDWLQNPYSWDGLVLNSSYDDIKYSVWHMTVDNDGAGNVGLAPAGQTPNLTDLEANGLDVHFGDVFDGNLHVHYYTLNGGLNGVNPVTFGRVGDNLTVLGFDWARDYNEWDFYVQYAAQGGDNGAAAARDYEGKMYHLAVGYDVDAENKVGLSYLSYSGDVADAGTADEGWVNFAGDNHGYLGFADVFDMENIEDITFTWDRKINDRNSFHLAYHMFSLENADSRASLLGNGLGAQAWRGAGENANAANNGEHFETDLGNELDLVWKHSLSNDVNLTVGYAMYAAGDYFTANRAAGPNVISPDVNYGWVTATVKF